MKDYYTERNYNSNYNNYSNNNYYTTQINQNSLFRNFLIDENVEDSRKKFFVPKKKEILPSYRNLKERIEEGRRDIKSHYNIKDTLFKDIHLKDLSLYSKFAKNFSLYFFGPNGIVTENNMHLKTHYNLKHKKNKRKLNAKIYAGRWLYLDENPKYVRYIARLKNNRKQILNIGGNFSTEDDFTQKLHDIYIKGSKKKYLKENKDYNTPKKNIFEFTAIDKPSYKKKKKNPNSLKKYIDKKNINNLLLNTSLNFKPKNFYNYTSEEIKNKTMYNDNNSSRGKNKLNIFLKDRLFEKEKSKKKKYFSNLKLTINTKIDSMNNPVKEMKKEIFLIKKKNKTFHTFRENKDKYKEDIQVIGEDAQKDTDDFMDKFIKKVYRNQLQNKKNNNPKKIFFTYFENKGNTVRESLKNFVKNIEKIKEEERKIKYSKSIREQFRSNFKLIKKLGNELDKLKIKKAILFDK